MNIYESNKLNDFDDLSRDFVAGDFLNNNLLESRFSNFTALNYKNIPAAKDKKKTKTGADIGTYMS